MRSFFIFLLLCPFHAPAQGKLVIVGGGSEEIGGWSDIPYRKIVQQAANKRIAVISYTDETSFIPDYFLSLGATAAVNIRIDSKALADQQSTYDSLMKFDAFFFKGGDQSFYYNYFKSTKTLTAIIDTYNKGGVLSGTSAGMAILSGVMFTALKNSVYPDDMLSNFNNTSATLANDFITVFPGFLFDTHFTERGRGARLIGFLTNWYIKTGELLTGLGVDDRTALCIDSLHIGSVFGTGTVSVYSAASFASSTGNKPVADSIHVIQLLHGNSIDLKTKTILKGPVHPISPSIASENGNYQVFLSGAEGVGINGTFLNAFIAFGNPADTIIVVTATGKGRAYTDQLNAKGAHFIIVETNEASNDVANLDLRNTLRRSHKILFVENDDTPLFNFIQKGPTGLLLAGHLKRNNVVSGFIGEDSRYAGKKFVTNHLENLYNAYYGDLHYQNGLGLLRTTTVMANTYDASSSDFYENTTAAVPYAMIRDSLKYGIYLERDSYLKFYQQSGQNYFSATGTLSTIVAINTGTLADFESQPVNSSGDVRNYVGFTQMRYAVLNGNSKVSVGTPQPSNDPPYEFERITGISETTEKISLPFPNPSSSGIFNLTGNDPGQILGFSITDVMGRIVQNSDMSVQEDVIRIDLSTFSNGIYILTWFTKNHRFTTLLVKG